MLKAKGKSIATTGDEEVIEIEGNESEEDTGGHGVINPVEAGHHIQRLDEALQNMMMKISGGEIKDILKDTLKEFQDAIAKIMPLMCDTNPLIILRAIKDPTCSAL